MRILAIGDTSSLAETRRVLSRSEYEMHRVPAALAAVRMVRQIPFDLMIVVHPLVDADFADFHGEIRARASPCRESQLLVLSSRSRLAELEDFRHDSRLEAVDVDLPQHRLAEVAARYLGPIRSAERYDLSLPVRWQPAGDGGVTGNLSASGALIVLATGTRPAPGERLIVELTLPDRLIALPAEVVRLTESPDDKLRGFAVTWIRAGLEELEQLERFLAVQV